MNEQFQPYSFSFVDVKPSFDEVLDFLQSADMEEEHPLLDSIREILICLEAHRNISGGYILKRIESQNIKKGIIRVENTDLEAGSQICGYMKGATQLALFICTAGDIFTKMASKYNSKGEYLEAYVADAIGSLTVERAMNRIQQDLEKKEIEKDLSISNRYSPGYCNWHLSGQKALFGLIGENPTNIILTESCLMNPIKSVSGIIGIGNDIKKREYGCVVCKNATCIYRKILNK